MSRELMVARRSPRLRRFDQLHFSFAGAVQDHQLTFGVTEDEDVAIAEVGFFDGFLESHGTHGDSFVGADEVDLSSLGNGRITMHGDGYGSLLRLADL